MRLASIILVTACLTLPACGRFHGDQRASSDLNTVGEPVTASDKKIAETCKDEALKVLQARLAPCPVTLADVKTSYIDNRWYNPSAYIWYTAGERCESTHNKNIQVMIQYSRGQCF